MPGAKSGDTVHVHYTGKLADGSVFDSSDGREPLTFTLGTGMVIDGFDAAILDMEPGDNKTVEIPVEKAYGHRMEELTIEVDKSRFANSPIEVGSRLQISNEEGHTMPVTIAAITDETVTLDANHPLAGKDLTFDLKLVGIDPAN